MRLIFRLLGTWLLALAVILAVIDGTRSLAANSLVMTPLRETWTQLNSASLDAVQAFMQSRLFGAALSEALEAVLNCPGFLVLAVPGIVLAIAGRSRYPRRFVRSDQI